MPVTLKWLSAHLGGRRVGYGHDGKTLVTSGRDSVIRVYDVEGLAALTDDSAEPATKATIEHHKEDVTCLALSPTGDRLASGDTASTVSDFGALWREIWRGSPLWGL